MMAIRTKTVNKKLICDQQNRLRRWSHHLPLSQKRNEVNESKAAEKLLPYMQKYFYFELMLPEKGNGKS